MASDARLTPEQLARLQDGFEQALAAGAEGAEAVLARLGVADPELAGEVRRLLEAHARTGRALDRPALLAALGDADRDPWIGARVGVYEVRRQIGSGGMGAVYEAVRADESFQMRVAIKVLRHHAAGEEARHRFRTERQILATLQHRNIAALLDGGVTPEGQPYFVMEYIEGEPLTTWCDARQLSIAERLGLFRQVCAAVQYAHQNLVIHRDLKPGNILVTADGTVKLLDFGIAKLLPMADDACSGDLPVTQVGLRAYTPEYASPEQVLGEPVSTRSDVYALGVVLFELLTGERPFRAAAKGSVSLEQLVTLAAPPRPSAVLSPTRPGLIGERTHERAQRRLAGDLDAICLQALRKEPEHRYGSAADLSADLHRHLTGLPVLARPEGVSYRVGRLVRRHRAASAAATLAVVSLVAGTVISVGQARAAEVERMRATEVTQFLTTMLRAARPTEMGREVLVREVLDSAAVQADELRDRPELEAEIRDIIGGTYRALGEFGRAEDQFRRLTAITLARTPGGDSSTVIAMTALSTVLELQGRYLAADSILTLAAPLLERYWGTGRGLIDNLDMRGRLLGRMGRLAEAQPLLARALALQYTIIPIDDDELSYSYANLGVVTGRLGDHVGAESLLVAGTAAARRYHGDVHPQVAALLSPLAGVQGMQGKVAAAESTYLEALTIRRTLLGEEHLDYAWTLGNYADLLVDNGRPAEAAVMARQVLALRDRDAENSHPNFGTALSVLGRALTQLDSLEAGIRALREALEVRQSLLPPGHYIIPVTQGLLGEHLARAGRFAEAESLLLESQAALVDALGSGSRDTRRAFERLVSLYEAWARPAQAAEWRAKVGPAGGT